MGTAFTAVFIIASAGKTGIQVQWPSQAYGWPVQKQCDAWSEACGRGLGPHAQSCVVVHGMNGHGSMYLKTVMAAQVLLAGQSLLSGTQKHAELFPWDKCELFPPCCAAHAMMCHCVTAQIACLWHASSRQLAVEWRCSAQK